jgi:cytochrome c oxidase subunit 1
MFIGFNVTFQPMMILGLIGMPRRIYSYPEGYGWDVWNLVATVGAFLIAFSVLVFIFNVILSLRRKEGAPADPWDGRTLEWSLPSPPPPYNFAEIPTVSHRDDFWHKKYAEDEMGNPVPLVAGAAVDTEEEERHDIHMPSPSFWPLVAAIGMPIIATGLIYDPAIVAVGGAITVFGLYGWALEPATESE